VIAGLFRAQVYRQNPTKSPREIRSA